jgi:uncharacterized membrane protein YcaP (DUF421 family)
MNVLLLIDWGKVFLPSGLFLEIILRGTAVYFFIFLIFRFLRRGPGAIGIADLLVVVLIADAAQNAMSAEYKSVGDGAILIATIVGWDFFLDWLGFHVPVVGKILRPRAVLLIKNGKLQMRNLRSEMISEDELLGELREQGVEDVKDVKVSYMESDGHISVVKKSKDDEGGKGAKSKGDLAGL